MKTMIRTPSQRCLMPSTNYHYTLSGRTTIPPNQRRTDSSTHSWKSRMSSGTCKPVVGKESRQSRAICWKQEHQDTVYYHQDHCWTFKIGSNSPPLSWWLYYYQGRGGWKNRQEEHFSQLLNWPSTVDQTSLNQIPQRPFQEDLDLLPPSEDEFKKAIAQMNSMQQSPRDGWSPSWPLQLWSPDWTPQSLPQLPDHVFGMNSVSPQSLVPDATIVTLYKNKGPKADVVTA